MELSTSSYVVRFFYSGTTSIHSSIYSICGKYSTSTITCVKTMELSYISTSASITGNIFVKWLLNTGFLSWRIVLIFVVVKESFIIRVNGKTESRLELSTRSYVVRFPG